MITLKIARVNNYPQVEQPKQIILPKTANELENMLLGMDINKQNNYRYELSDVKTPYPQIDECLKGCNNIDEVNYIANFLNGMNPKKEMQIDELLKVYKPQCAKDFIVLSQKAANLWVYLGASNFEQLGEIVAEHFHEGVIDSPLGMHIDYKAYGEGFHDSHGGQFVGGSYVVDTYDKPVYDGKFLPYIDDGQIKTMTVLLSNPELMVEDVEIIKGITMTFPASEYAIERAARKLGVEMDECWVAELKFEDTNFQYMFDINDTIFEINELAGVISNLSNDNTKKFVDVMEYEQYVPIDQLINIALNLDCYEYEDGNIIRNNKDIQTFYSFQEDISNVMNLGM